MYFEVDINIYSKTVFVSLAQSDKKFFNSLKKSGVKIKKRDKWAFDLKNCSGKCITEDKDNYIVIRLPVIPKEYWYLGTLNHEILHAVVKIMKWAGMELSDSSEEAYTYLQGYLTREILGRIKKFK